MRLLGLLFVGCALGACYNPSYGDCQVSCASGACPAGLECQSGVCRAAGMTGPCTMVDGGGIDAPSLTIEEMNQAAIEYLCKYAVRCGTFEDQPSCAKVYGNLITPQADLIAAVMSGTVIFHGDKAKACYDARDTLGCERWKAASTRTIDPSCDGVFEGMRHDGETCAISEQCISGFCMPATCSDACCGGTCVGDAPPGPRNVGETCGVRDRCTNSFCDQFTHTCREYFTTGTSCQYGDQCADGDGCVASAQAPQPVCETLVATDGPCSVTAECLMSGDVCQAGKCTHGGLTGTPCQILTDCQQLHQCTNTSCALPPGIGGNCQGSICMEGYCEPTTQVCVEKIANGGNCQPNFGMSCESGYCDATMMMCADKPVCN